MIIQNIATKITTKTVTISAEVTLNKKREIVFFSVDKAYKHFLASDATAFLALLLLPAMRLHEDVTIHGCVSKRVLENTQEVMRIFAKWDKRYKKIAIHVDKRDKDTYVPNNNASFFTGGIDSFYTYLTNKKEISHFLLIHGSDIPLENNKLFRITQKHITQIAKEEKRNVIVVKTNIRPLLEQYIEWEWELGGLLASVSLLLRKGLKTVYLAGSMRYDQLSPYGTHPAIDPLWSTETLSLVHDGINVSRLEKVFIISQSSLALAHLRVCTHNFKGAYNCGICFKCVQTMMELTCANALKNAKTFPKKISYEDVRKLYYNRKYNFHLFGKDVLEYLKKYNKEPKLQKALAESLYNSLNPSLPRQIADYIAYLDKTYLHRVLYHLIFNTGPSDDRTLAFKLLAKGGFIK